MEEEYKPKSFEATQKELSDKESARAKRIEELRLTTYNWMKNDAAIQQYLQQFNSYSQETFMQQYAQSKSLFMEYADMHASIRENREEGGINDAQKRLMDIQLKKLFDIMLQWDARLIDIQDIKCSWDFFKWTHNFSQCPFLTPVTQQEFDLYMQYANTADFEYDQDMNLLELDNLRNDEGMMLPEWFLFENLHTGNNKYLVLPRLRTAKENFYQGLWRKEENEKMENKYAAGTLEKPNIDTRPMAPYFYYSGIEGFVKNFENKEAISKFYKYYEMNTDQLIRDNKEDEEHGYLNERVNNAIFHLADVREKIPVNAQSDWRLAVIEAYENYCRNQVRTGLKYAYEDYCMRLSSGMTYLTDEKHFEEMEGLATSVGKQILRGRELNNEPVDFDY